MGALANYIERAGVATASISLIREQSEAVRPPRAARGSAEQLGAEHTLRRGMPRLTNPS